MINGLARLMKKPLSGLIILITIFIILPYLICNFFGQDLNEKLKIFFILFAILIIAAELIFRFFYRLYYGSKYVFIKKMPFKKLHIEPHPYFTYAYKKNFQSPPAEKLNYPLHSNYYSANLTTNNFGFNNGIQGNRDIQVPKPESLFRINCIGASTTANYISTDNKTVSYPLELEKILKSKSKKNIEVNNCGVAGYNSADLLISFMLQNIDTKPNTVIIYHAYNDIEAYLKPNFRSDYSHSRKNLGEAYWKYKWFFPSNIRYSLLEFVSKGEPDTKINFSDGLKTYERNIQNIISLCLSKNIEIILCTYCFYLHKKIKNKSLHILYENIVNEENIIMKKLAEKNNIKIVDCSSLIPKKDENFLDSVHFTPKGMRLLAEKISEVININ